MSSSSTDRRASGEGRHFIQQIIDADLESGRVKGDIVTRFPPEPNGFLHIGHVKAICVNFGIAEEYGGRYHLRFDDTNPEKESMAYVDSIQETIRWLGFDWGEHLYFASDYFEKLYAFAQALIRAGKAYVDGLDEEQIRAYRGTVTEPGRESPDRNRSIEDNLDLFERMKDGEFPDGKYVLRARIDMASPNMLMRDPLLYRIRHFSHYRRGTDWCIYPMYDMAHPLGDAIEGITHSLCSLEFEVHRPLYDWLVDNVRAALAAEGDDTLADKHRPHQYEFARLNLDYTVMSKRKLLRLVDEGHVDGWDDPRLWTIAGLRRRGYTPTALRHFADLVGVAKAANRIDMSVLEFAIRDDLNDKAPRVMCVTDPLKVVLTNVPDESVEQLDAPYWPHDIPKEGSRPVPFTREIWIEQDDFMEEPSKKFHRLSPGGEVRLRHAYIIRCDEVVKDDAGNILELRCSIDPETRSGSDTSGKRVKGTIHWVSVSKSVPVEVRLYDRLFRSADPEDVEEGRTFLDNLNPDSIEIRRGHLEPSAADALPGTWFQFERLGFFFRDEETSRDGLPVWNRTVTLRDTWARISESGGTGSHTTAPEPKNPSKSEPVGLTDPFADLDEASIRRARDLESRFGLPLDAAAVLAARDAVASFFEEAASGSAPATSVANWLINELRPLTGEGGVDGLKFGPQSLARLVELHEDGTLSSRLAREVLEEMVASGAEPDSIVESRGLRQISDEGALSAAVDEVLAAHPDRVEAYRGGKSGLIGFFMGQVMGKTGGKANPKVVQALLKEKLGG